MFDFTNLYCRQVIGHTKALDKTRPVTFVSASDYGSDKAVSQYDIVSPKILTFLLEP